MRYIPTAACLKGDPDGQEWLSANRRRDAAAVEWRAHSRTVALLRSGYFDTSISQYTVTSSIHICKHTDGMLLAETSERVVFLRFTPNPLLSLYSPRDQFGNWHISQIVEGRIGLDKTAPHLSRIRRACGFSGHPLRGHLAEFSKLRLNVGRKDAPLVAQPSYAVEDPQGFPLTVTVSRRSFDWRRSNKQALFNGCSDIRLASSAIWIASSGENLAGLANPKRLRHQRRREPHSQPNRRESCLVALPRFSAARTPDRHAFATLPFRVTPRFCRGALGGETDRQNRVRQDRCRNRAPLMSRPGRDPAQLVRKEEKHCCDATPAG